MIPKIGQDIVEIGDGHLKVQNINYPVILRIRGLAKVAPYLESEKTNHPLATQITPQYHKIARNKGKHMLDGPKGDNTMKPM